MSDHEKRIARWEKKKGVKRKKDRTYKFKRQVSLDGNPLVYLMDWYAELRAGMDAVMGYKPIPPSEIVAFRDLHGLDLDTFDADTIRRLDTVWLKSRPKPTDPKTGKPV